MPPSLAPIRLAGASVALLVLLAAPAWASDQVTVNHTDKYVDPSISSAFVTTPNLCTEPIGTQGTSPDGCDALGDAAVLAATGSGPDIYFEPFSQALSSTNAFVPGNSGSTVGDTGFSPIFTFHKYDLFGRAEDRMGLLNREEILFLASATPPGTEGITTGQTIPGSDALNTLLVTLLMAPEGATTYNAGGHVFDYADMAYYTNATGFSTGKRTTVINWCDTTFSPALCGSLSDDLIGELYLAVNFPKTNPSTCYSNATGLSQSAYCGFRDGWMDQTVVGYVQAWDSLGGDGHFAENFRSQIGFDPNDLILDSGTLIVNDQRIQQSVELSGAFTTEATDPGDTVSPANMDNVAGRQTFEQAIRTLSHQSLEGIDVKFDQMVSQDVNGYFSSCINCDTAANQALGYDHAFTPAKLDLTFMPYSAGWQTVPTVTHAP